MPYASSINKNTFAFSERQNSWTTRYGFVPTCYANCGDSMLSSKDNTAIWLHDVNEERNKFYDGGLGASSVEVSFNDLPSDVKVFNSVSIETNISNLGASFFLSDEVKQQELPSFLLVDTATFYTTPFYIGDEEEKFVDLEGIKYCPVPRVGDSSLSISNNPEKPSDSSFIYMGAISLDSTLYDASFFEEQEGFYEFKVRLSKSSGNAIPVGKYNPQNPIVPSGPDILIPSETNFKVLAFDIDTGQDVLINRNEQINAFTANGIRNSLSVVGQDGDILTLRYERITGFSGVTAPSFVPFELFVSNANPVNPVIAEPFSFVLNSGEPLFLATPNVVNGEQARSTYMRTRFNINSLGKYMEINAVNCDYDLSRNHHSLTQNS